MPDGQSPLSGKDQQEIQEKLNNNALLVALMMISPAEALAAAGHKFKASDFEDVSPPTAEDARLIKALKASISSGETSLSSPIILQPAQDANSLKPPAPKAKSKKQPDVALSVSVSTIQYALKRFTQDRFKEQEFILPELGWWTFSAKGKDITLDLNNDSALVKASLDGTVEFTLLLLGFRLASWKSEFPISIDILASFNIDDNNLLYLSIYKGQISMVNAPFPVSLTTKLLDIITSIVPPYSIGQCPHQLFVARD